MGPGSAWSLLQIIAGFGTSLALGFGVSYSLLPKDVRRYAMIVSPTAGYAIFCLLAIAISSNLRIPANTSVWIAFGALMTVSVAAGVIALRRGEIGEMRRAARPMVWALALMAVMVFWPVIYQGTELYLGTANPDFYQSLAYQDVLTRFNIGALAPRPAVDYSLNPFLATFPDPMPAKFGGVMFSLLQEKLLGISARAALMTSLVVFLLSLPLATYFFSKVVLEVGHPVAFGSALLIAVSGPVTMSFIHVLVGQNSALPLLPLGMSLCYLAIAKRDWRALLFSFLLLDATFWIYVSILPYIAAPIGLYAVYDAVRNRRSAGRWVVTAATVFLLGSLLLQLGMGREAGQLVTDITSLFGRANRTVYVDFLTEMSTAYSLGLSSYPYSSSFLLSVQRHPNYAAWNIGFVIFSFFGLAFYFRSVAAWARQTSGRSRPFILITLAVYVCVWSYFSFVSLYGYAIFKMASWLQFVYVPFIAYGLQATLGRFPGSAGRARLEAMGASVIGVAIVAANVLASLDFDAKSLGKDTRKGSIVNSYGIGGNSDYPELEPALSRWMKPGEVVGIAMPDFISNLWSAYYVVKAGMKASFVSHDDFPDEDAVLPDVKTGLVRNSAGRVDVYRPKYSYRGQPAYYLLEGRENLNRDIVPRPSGLDPAWSDGSFMLVEADKAKDVLLTGRGFYRLEYFDKDRLSWWWPATMRWTPEGGEFILLNASRPQVPHYLSFVAIAGEDREKPRHIELWLNGQLFDSVTMHGASRIVSKPFYPTGSRDKLVVKVRERVNLSARNFGLWNRQISTDQRYLNLVIAQTAVLTSDESKPGAFQGTLTAKGLIDRSRRFDGISLDGWAAPAAYFELPIPEGKAGKFLLSIGIPGWAGFKFPFVVRFRANGRAFERRFDEPGNHKVEIDAEAGSGSLLLEMDSEQSALVAGVGEGSFMVKSLVVK